MTQQKGREEFSGNIWQPLVCMGNFQIGVVQYILNTLFESHVHIQVPFFSLIDQTGTWTIQ